MLSQRPEFAIEIICSLVDRVAALTSTVKSLGLIDVEGRVVRLLAEISGEHGGPCKLKRMTQQEIADRVGASREMISRVLKELSRKRYITIEDHHITILRQLPCEL